MRLFIACCVLISSTTRVGGVPLSARNTKAAAPTAAELGSPADPIAIGVESVIATTFLKLNRTISFKEQEDEKFQRQVNNASASAKVQFDLVEKAAKCVADEQAKQKEAANQLVQLAKQGEHLNASIANLQRSIEMREVAQNDLVSKIGDWKEHITSESDERVGDLKRSSDMLLDNLKHARSAASVDKPDFAKAVPSLESGTNPAQVSKVVDSIPMTHPTPGKAMTHDSSTVSFLSIEESPVAGDELCDISPVELDQQAECPVAKCAEPDKGCEMDTSTRYKGSDGMCCPKLCNQVCPSEESSSPKEFDQVYGGVLEMLHKYDSAHDLLNDSVKVQLADKEAAAAEAASGGDNTVHQVVLQQLRSTQKTIKKAVVMEEVAIQAAKAAEAKCRSDKSDLEPGLARANVNLGAIKSKKVASDAFYAKHVATFRQTIEFAEDTLTEIEARASTEFRGKGWDAQLKKMRDDIARTLDLCGRLQGIKHEDKLTAANETKPTSTAPQPDGKDVN